MLLTRIIDAPVRAFVYEGSAGAPLVSAFCSRSHIPFGLVGVAEPPDVVADLVDRLLTGPPDGAGTHAP
jgi:hypothetical protein